jgi:hypothetical protein
VASLATRRRAGYEAKIFRSAESVEGAPRLLPDFGHLAEERDFDFLSVPNTTLSTVAISRRALQLRSSSGQ